MEFINDNKETILIVILGLYIMKLLYDNRESFTPNLARSNARKQCNYNDKNLDGHCKEIRDGCFQIKDDEKNMEAKLMKKCTLAKDANTARETISQKRDCVTDVERLIRANYAKKELCARIKNMPEKLNKDEKLKSNNLSDVQGFDKNGAFSDLKF